MLVCFLALSFLSANSEVPNKNIYSGGMLFLQPGIIITENNHQKIQDSNFGLGGILRFYFYEYFTAGVFGGTNRTSYVTPGSTSSYLSIGYGGPMVGISRKINKYRFTISAFAGKGTIRNLHVQSQNDNVLTEAYIYKESSMVYSPILSIDYALTQRLHLTMQGLCLMAKFNNGKALYNPTLQIGILFNR